MAVLESTPDVLSPAVPLPATWHFRIGWTAAFLEGEGCFRAGTRGVQVSAKQVQRVPLEWLQLMFGGSVTKRLTRTNEISEWRVNGYASVGLVMSLYLFLSPKRQHEILKALQKWRGQRVTNGLRVRCIHGHPLETVPETWLTMKQNGQRRYCPMCHRMARHTYDRRRMKRIHDRCSLHPDQLTLLT
jgi:hypothetical protein